MTDIFLKTTNTQPIIKELSIGSDPYKDGDDTYKQDKITLNQ